MGIRGVVRRARGGALLALGVVLLAGAMPARAGSDPAQPGGDDVVLRAMRDELARSMAGLRLEGMDAPYYVEYAVEDSRVYKLTAVLGAIEKEERGSERRLRVGVRVGSRQLDNTGFASGFGSYGRYGGSWEELPVENSYEALRREIWLATDRAYKEGLGELAAKRASFENRKREEIPDLSAEEPSSFLAPPAAASGFDEGPWRERMRSLSAIYRDYPAIQESGTSLRLLQITRYFVNSEGTVVRRPADVALFLAGAQTQAADGMTLYATVPLYQGALSELASGERIAAAVRESAERLKSSVAAPVAERYIGPVLLAPEASAQLVVFTLLPALSGERPPAVDDEQMSAYFRPGAFSGRVGRRVLPSFLSVEDDPLRADLDGRALFGSYPVDDQGVPARRLSLVEDGILKTLLMSRRPGYGISQSNGHGRSAGREPPRATAGNLIVTATGGKSFADLKKELIERCRKEGLEHGLVITSLGLPPAAELQSSLMSLMMGGGGEGGVKISAIVAARIFVADGREEPVRGLLTGDFTPRALLAIEAAGAERHVLNLFSADDGTVMGMIRSFATTLSDETGRGVPISVAAPALLFPELEFSRSEAPQQKPPLTAQPLAR